MDQYVRANGISMRYRLDGQKTGRTLVLVHGVGGRLEDWNGVVDQFGSKYRIVRVDMRGHGSSDKPVGPYLLDVVATDISKLLNSLGVRRSVLVGNSLGGLVAQAFALLYPDQLDALVILAGIADRTQEEKQRVLERLAIVEAGEPGSHFDKSLSRWFTDEFVRSNPERIANMKLRNQENDPRAYAAAYRMLATNDLADQLHKISVPTLIATGEFDIGSSPRMARVMHERVVGSKLHIFEGLRHGIVAEAPAKVASIIDRFLDELPNSNRPEHVDRGQHGKSQPFG
jgi:pimeloyl-ACP methyl ester carboxylesterase